MVKSIARSVGCAALFAVVAGLGGCADETMRLAPHFSESVRQDMAAQIADPDAHYAGSPAPGSNGARVGLAQSRYEANKVIPPAATSTSTVSSNGGSASQ